MSKETDILDQIVDDVQKEDAPKTLEASSAVTSDDDVTTTDPSSMEDLLVTDHTEIPQVGDVVTGTVINVEANEVLLDLGLIGTGVVLGRETKDGLAGGKKLELGDEVSATLTESENDDGYIELSIREASHEKAWDDLRNKVKSEDVVSTKILDANKGGLMTEVNGITGFLPVSQLSSANYPRVDDGDKNKILELLKKLIGQELTVRILDANQEEDKLIVSEKAAQSEADRKIIQSLNKGDTIKGEVSGVVDFGAFVKFSPSGKEDTPEDNKLEGLVHISELAWQLIDDPREIIKVGDQVEAKIIGIDDTRISLSMKALKADPWVAMSEKYKVGEIYDGKVDKINHFGAFVYLDNDIHGLAHVSEFSEKYPGKKMEDMITSGESYKWKVLSIEPKEHRMGLVLDAA